MNKMKWRRKKERERKKEEITMVFHPIVGVFGLR